MISIEWTLSIGQVKIYQLIVLILSQLSDVQKAILIVVLFVKRQIIRFTLKNRRGPHYSIGANAPKFLKKEIERRLLLTNEIKTEPLLISGENQFKEFQSTDEGKFLIKFFLFKLIDVYLNGSSRFEMN